MTEIIQKDFRDLRKGDRILVEVIVDCRNEDSAYVMLEGGEYDEDSMTIGPDKYRGCVAPEPKTLKVGMTFRHRDSDVDYRIYAIENGKVFYFRCAHPGIIFEDTLEHLAAVSSLIWVEE